MQEEASYALGKLALRRVPLGELTNFDIDCVCAQGRGEAENKAVKHTALVDAGMILSTRTWRTVADLPRGKWFPCSAADTDGTCKTTKGDPMQAQRLCPGKRSCGMNLFKTVCRHCRVRLAGIPPVDIAHEARLHP